MALSVCFSFNELKAQEVHVFAYAEGSNAVFETDGFDGYSQKLQNQNKTIQNTLEKSHTKAQYKAHNGFSESFFNLVKSEKKENIFKAEKEIHFSLDYILNEQGEALACAIIMPKEQVFLSASEIQAVLQEAMSHKFKYINKPISISNFYFTVTYSYNNML
ncbi:hypothetical protein LG651_03955 [Tamlana sp. 62-3]|uniref:Uncharacterized protein n=1 Tax=Neotamlana sargassicola TaxID=2883125 RepID=A0A9X1L6B1_9FLAO|nr:hypothetical protein [Tamlana sargassicola]MCB4807394.1 hypothetical protein [Tamlana sargassicola]